MENKDNLSKNINIFKYLTNIDNYVIEYLNILNLKIEKEINYEMDIDKYYINFFKNIINDLDINDTVIVTQQNNIPNYNKFIRSYSFSNIYSVDTLINHGSNSFLYLYYIISNWDKLPNNIFFYNNDSEYNFPIELYIIPKKELNTLMNNYCFSSINNYNISFSKEEKKKIKYKCDLSFSEWWGKYIKKDIPDILEYCPNLVFSVNTKKIKENSLEYYKNILNSIYNKPYCEEIFFLDRCWYYIFNY
jgi:hypothetical protein